MHQAVAIVLAVGLLVSACGGTSQTGSQDDPESHEDAAAVGGKELYEANCAACHAEGGVGIEGAGIPLVGSEFVASLSDSELVEFLLVGRDITDPLNTTGILKPPKGANPSLTEEDFTPIIHYLRSLGQ
jgi:mono/diheme cytochrome c family protein